MEAVFLKKGMKEFWTMTSCMHEKMLVRKILIICQTSLELDPSTQGRLSTERQPRIEQPPPKYTPPSNIFILIHPSLIPC
jgi:hypothetical protein